MVHRILSKSLYRRKNFPTTAFSSIYFFSYTSRYVLIPVQPKIQMCISKAINLFNGVVFLWLAVEWRRISYGSNFPKLAGKSSQEFVIKG
jgi:hypothetical protein